MCAVGGVVNSAGCSGNSLHVPTNERESEPNNLAVDGNSSTPTESQKPKKSSGPPVDIRGAIYLPTHAFNIYQMWNEYDPAVIERDLGYATRVNLNAIRAWVSYRFWRQDSQAFERRFEHFLQTAADRGLTVLIGFFEAIGGAPTKENLTDHNLMTATSVISPGANIVLKKHNWHKARSFVTWFMKRYASDDRLMAIEVMNEPGWIKANIRFSKAMFQRMRELKGSVPLTVGSSSMSANTTYADWNPDIYQFHYNFPRSKAIFRDAVRQVETLASNMEHPVLLTEWQRVRSSIGFHSAPPRNQRTPDYSSMAPIIREAGVGNFFWSLMVKPAYFASQRNHAILNGLFHEDGAVWSRDDARSIKAMSGDPEFNGEERPEWPEWALPIKKHVYGSQSNSTTSNNSNS